VTVTTNPGAEPHLTPPNGVTVSLICDATASTTGVVQLTNPAMTETETVTRTRNVPVIWCAGRTTVRGETTMTAVWRTPMPVCDARVWTTDVVRKTTLARRGTEIATWMNIARETWCVEKTTAPGGTGTIVASPSMKYDHVTINIT